MIVSRGARRLDAGVRCSERVALFHVKPRDVAPAGPPSGRLDLAVLHRSGVSRETSRPETWFIARR